jgi:hypothetical protein
MNHNNPSTEGGTIKAPGLKTGLIVHGWPALAKGRHRVKVHLV